MLALRWGRASVSTPRPSRIPPSAYRLARSRAARPLRRVPIRAPINAYKAVGAQAEHDVDDAQHQRLRPDRTVVTIDELREEREEEQRHFRVQEADDERLGEQLLLQSNLRRGHDRCVARCAYRFHAEVDQIEPADDLDGGERDRRRHDNCRQTGDCGEHVHDGCGVNSEHRHQAGSHSLCPASSDDEQHRWTRYHEQRHRRGDEHGKCGQRWHEPTIRAHRDARWGDFECSGYAAARRAPWAAARTTVPPVHFAARAAMSAIASSRHVMNRSREWIAAATLVTPRCTVLS